VTRAGGGAGPEESSRAKYENKGLPRGRKALIGDGNAAMTIENTPVARRALITGAAAAAGAAAFAAPARAARFAGLVGRTDAAQPSRRLATGSIGDWQAAVGTIFTARTEVGVIGLRLASVSLLAATGARPGHLARDHGFIARFEPVGAVPAGNRSYRLASADHPPMHVFFGGKADGLTAVFN
jgi:hypothetical protein